jgi:hypothetical protein
MESGTVKLCDYGCGQVAIHQFKNGKWCCSTNFARCPINKILISCKMKGKNNPKPKSSIYLNLDGKLCDYGCGQVAKFQLKNKKYCCSDYHISCPEIIKKNIGNKGKIRKVKKERIKPEFCDYGCGKEAIHQFKNGKWCCSLVANKCKNVSSKNPGFSNHKHNKKTIENYSKTRSGENHPFFNKHHSEESINKIRKSNTGKSYHTDKWLEILKQRMICGQASYMNSKVNRKKQKIEASKRMKNGGAAHSNSFIQNPSKPQVELYNRIKLLYPEAVLNYPSYELNYSLDVAIPNLKIWFESDGSYWHQDKEKDLKRQQKIENLGWKCIRYSNVDTIKQVPSVEKIKEDINKIINGF